MNGTEISVTLYGLYKANELAIQLISVQFIYVALYTHLGVPTAHRVPACLDRVKAGHVHFCRVAGNTV